MILPSGDVPGAEVRSIRKNVGEAPSSILGIPRYVRAITPINLFYLRRDPSIARLAASRRVPMDEKSKRRHVASRVVLCYNSAITMMR